MPRENLCGEACPGLGVAGGAVGAILLRPAHVVEKSGEGEHMVVRPGSQPAAQGAKLALFLR